MIYVLILVAFNHAQNCVFTMPFVEDVQNPSFAIMWINDLYMCKSNIDR